jgi:hypothetical protein
MQHVQLPSDGTPLELPDARLRYFQYFFNTDEAEHFYSKLSRLFLGNKTLLLFLEKPMTSLGLLPYTQTIPSLIPILELPCIPIK